MEVVADIPSWMRDIIAERAKAAGVTFNEALVASLDVRAHDFVAETAGWAVEHGVRVRAVARRVHYSPSSVESAAHRFRRSR